MKHTKNTIIKESIESRELSLYADNKSTLYPAIVAVVRNLARYYKRGQFDKAKAVDAFYPVACRAAQMYCREFASLEDAARCFDVTARYTAAADLLTRYMEDIENGGL